MKCVHVLRKPCSEPTVAANVLRWGTGALNIDATRISTSDNLNGGAYAVNPTERWDGAENWRYKRGDQGNTGEYQQPSGRWPANLILQHLDGCVQEGTRRVKASGFDQSRPPRSSGIVYGKHKDTPQVRHSDPDGTETVAAWVCAPGCPVAGLDAQSGTTKAAMRKPTGKPIYATKGTAMVWNSNSVTDTTERGFTDEGGASRYFKQVKP